MPDLNDFYAYKTTTSGSGSGGSKNDNSNNSSGGNYDVATVLIVLAIVGWVLWLISK